MNETAIWIAAAGLAAIAVVGCATQAGVPATAELDRIADGMVKSACLRDSQDWRLSRSIVRLSRSVPSSSRPT